MNLLKLFRTQYDLLDSEKVKLKFMLFLFVLLSMMDLLSLGLVLPLASLVVDLDVGSELTTYINIFFEIPDQKADMLIFIGWSLLAVFTLKAIAAILINRVIIRFAEWQQYRMRNTLLFAYQRQSYKDFLGRNSSEFVYNIQHLTGQYAASLSLALRLASDSVVAVVIVAFLIYSVGPILIGIAFFILLLVLCYDRAFRPVLRNSGSTAIEAATGLVKSVQEAMDGFKEIQIMRAQSVFDDRLRRDALRYFEHFTRSNVLSTSPRYLLEFLLFSGLGLFVVISVALGNEVQSLVPVMAVLVVAAIRLLPVFNTFSNNLIQLRYHTPAIEKLRTDHILASKLKTKVLDEISNDWKEPATEEFSSIALDNVSFRYAQDSKDVLSSVSLELKVGEMVGILGESGAGKTTLVDLLLGLNSPTSGQILVNGKACSKDRLWNYTAYLPQEIFLFDDTIFANITLGDLDENIDIDKVKDSLKNASMYKFVHETDDGLYTRVGERGEFLSGGQKQRIALARAFYHSKPIIVLDEATSALDKNTEDQIIDQLVNLKGACTIIIISHNPKIIARCDKSYKIVEGDLLTHNLEG